MVAPTPEGRVLAALLRHVEAMTDAPPVVSDNAQFPEPSEAPDTYLLVSVSGGTPARRYIDPSAESQLRGFLNIGIMSPLNDGPQAATDLGGTIASWLDGQTLLEGSTRVRIVSRPRVAGGYKDRDRWRTPVVAEYETTGV